MAEDLGQLGLDLGRELGGRSGEPQKVVGTLAGTCEVLDDMRVHLEGLVLEIRLEGGLQDFQARFYQSSQL